MHRRRLGGAARRPRRGGDAPRLRAVLGLPGRRGRPGRRRPGRQRLQRRERGLRRGAVRGVRHGRPAARSPAAAGWSPSRASTAPGSRSCPAGAAGSCCGRTAARPAWSTRRRGIKPMTEVLPDAFGVDRPRDPLKPSSVADAPRAGVLVAPGANCRDQTPVDHEDQTMSEAFDAVDVIRAKRDGQRLSDEQVDWVVDAYTRGRGRRRADVGAGHGDPAAAAWTAARSAAGPPR